MTGPFHDLQAFTRLPRTSGLALSPDGTRLVTAVSLLDQRGGGSTTSLWEVDPTGERAARRLTRGARGESSPVFTPAGDLLFTSSRTDPAAVEGATFDEPRRPPRGIPHVWVAGVPLVTDGARTGATPGRSLRPLLPP